MSVENVCDVPRQRDTRGGVGRGCRRFGGGLKGKRDRGGGSEVFQRTPNILQPFINTKLHFSP